MGDRQTEKDRVRAFVLLRAENSDEVAERIYEEYGKKGGDDFVVVRADVVDGAGDDFNIVVPIDAHPDHFSEIERQVTSVEGVNAYKTLAVKNHYPTPTYLAHGYTTTEDFAEKMSWLETPPDEYGRIMKNSPGHNPWG